MSRSGLPSHNSPAYGTVVPFRSRIPLCGWGTIGRSDVAHYLENGRPRCLPSSVATQARLVGSLKGRERCVVCAQASKAVPA